jgi:aspartyl protease family protein
MNGMDAAYAIYALLAMMLVGSSLAARRLPMSDIVKMALIWVAIFAAGFAFFMMLQAFGLDLGRFG